MRIPIHWAMSVTSILFLAGIVQAAATPAESDQIRRAIDTEYQNNRAAVEQSVRAAVSNNWPDAARTLLRGMKSSGSILALPLPALRGEGIAQDQAEILSHFPEAMRYAASKVGQNVNLSEPISQDVVNVRQAIDVAAQSNRGMLENSVKAAQSGTWEDAAYSLCASINSPWSCVAVFPAAIQYAASKIGQTVAIGNSIEKPNPNVSLPVEGSTTSGGRVCVRDERVGQAGQIICGELVR